MVRVKKMTPTFRMFFQNAFVVQLHRKLEGFFWRALGLYTQVSETLCSIAYRSSRAVFVSFRTPFVTSKQHSNGNGFHKRVSLLLTHTVAWLDKCHPLCTLWSKQITHHFSPSLFSLLILTSRTVKVATLNRVLHVDKGQETILCR